MSEGYTVHIRDNASGEVRCYDEVREWRGESDDYLWGEGNFACDCNRASFFAYAAGTTKPEGRSCGSDAYMVWITAPDGTLLYADLGAPPTASRLPSRRS